MKGKGKPSTSDKPAAPLLPWKVARVCPSTRKPLDEDGMCWECGGYHGGLLPKQACGTCGGRVERDGWCHVCQHEGGGTGYERVRELWYRCDEGSSCELGAVDPQHRYHVTTVYRPGGPYQWLTKAQAGEMMREICGSLGKSAVRKDGLT